MSATTTSVNGIFVVRTWFLNVAGVELARSSTKIVKFLGNLEREPGKSKMRRFCGQFLESFKL